MSTCPNCGSKSQLVYTFGDTGKYAFTLCMDCDEEWDEYSDDQE